MGFKSALLQEVWEKDFYARSSELEWKRTFSKNFALVKLLDYSKSAKKILDSGCGDGRIISAIWRRDARFWGADLSKRAISSAQTRFRSKRNVDFTVGDLEKLPYKNSSFDLVYSTYTLEHTESPERIVGEMIRVTKLEGLLIFACPNFGSPFQPSGNKSLNGDSLKVRALKNFIKSHIYLIFKPKSLDWSRVVPRVLEEGKWQSDWDATCEPYMQTLLIFLRKKGLSIIETSSGLENQKAQKNGNLPFRFKILKTVRIFFEFLGRMGISPYKYFGPTLFVVARRKESLFSRKTRK